ncbi:MAG: phospholipase D-like domain-containing protein, partial [Cetobacterium sp.]
MKSIKVTDENEIIMGRGKYGYQKVLDDFDEAKKILIITYNISLNIEQKLINYLKKAKPECEVTIVTNVPGRFERYYNERARETARGKIEKYTRILNPDNYEFKVSIYYNTLNHAKFISTENIAYMGSQNFSDESKNNYESGILFTDKNLI